MGLGIDLAVVRAALLERPTPLEGVPYRKYQDPWGQP